MAAPLRESMIVIKKSDGTVVRMTLAEFKALQAQKTTANRPASSLVSFPPAVPSPAATEPTLPLVALPSELEQKTDPVTPSEHQTRNTEITPLLEEPLDAPVAASSPRVSPSRVKDAGVILAKSKAVVDPAQREQVVLAIQACLKDLKSYDDTYQLLTAPVGERGFAVDPRAAAAIIALCQTAQNDAATQPPDFTIQAKAASTGSNSLINHTPNLPSAYHEPEVPAVATPLNSYIHGPLPSSGAAAGALSALRSTPAAQATGLKPSRSLPGELPAMPPQPNVAAEKEFKLASEPRPKPVMQDIVYKPLELGPVEEIRAFTLVDWRRLSNKPGEAANRLEQKFKNLKEESIVLYLDALTAWRQSPLYREYIAAVADALKKRQKITAVLADKRLIQPAEIMALVEMEKQLSI